ncbi:TniQ family protein [Paraburkholderia sp. EG287B]|uniref:TniQ family protein n=1 Tax=Paraburkholderia sp. EG287B TaxID=3237010 RepID=UPI0034D37D89
MDIEMATEVGGRGEQLSSLALRCAERLSVPFGDFYRELVAPRIYEGSATPAVQRIPRHGTVDGMLQSADMWAKAMNSLLNRSDLRRATMLSWRQSLAPRALVRTHRAWCPVCLHEFASHGRMVYEPLVWRISDVVVCPHHGVCLEVQCPHCGRGRQPSFGAFTRVGCCRGCGKWLGRLIPGESTSISELDLFLSCTVEEALSLSNVRDDIDLIASDVAVRALREVFFCGSSAQMGRSLGLLQRQVGYFADGTYPAPLQLFVRASYATGVTMEQIFVTNKFGAEESARKKPHFEVHRAGARRLQLGPELATRLDDALADGGRLSVGAVAEGLNITATTVWRRERELASRLAQMHAEFMAREAQAQREKYQAKVIAFIMACATRGITPTRTQIDMECEGDGSLSLFRKQLIIKAAIAQVAMLAQSMDT